MKGRQFLIIAPQRGCPFSCSFCTCQTYYGKVLRKRTAGHVIAEIEYDINQYNVRDFFFWAETFVVDKGCVEDLCRAILEKGLNISWTCNSRIDIVDRQLLNLMARAGCWMISYGIESGEQRVLDKAGKGTRVEQAFAAVQLAKMAGIKTAGHFIFGLPGETQQSMEKTIRLSGDLGLDIAQFYSAVPFPGSRLYETAEKEGWIRDPDFNRFSQNQAVMELPQVSARMVNRCRSRAFKKYYYNPSAWYRIFTMLEYKGIKNALKTVLDFRQWTG